MTDIGELEKQFIMDEDAERLNLEQLVKRLVPICRVDANGFVHFSDRRIITDLNQADIVHLVLVARLVGHQLQEKAGKDVSISEVATADEVARMTGIPKNAVTARLADLKKSRRAEAVRRGEFKASVSYVEELLNAIAEDLEEEHEEA